MTERIKYALINSGRSANPTALHTQAASFITLNLRLCGKIADQPDYISCRRSYSIIGRRGGHVRLPSAVIDLYNTEIKTCC